MIRLVVDIGLPPAWIDVFTRHGWSAVHWSAVGDPRAKDRVVMAWAREQGHVVFTHDLDFGTLLALTRASGPSVIQSALTTFYQTISRRRLSPRFERTKPQLEQGAIVTIDESRGRVRILPIGPAKK